MRVTPVLIGVLAALVLLGALGAVSHQTGRLNTAICDGDCPAEFIDAPLEALDLAPADTVAALAGPHGALDAGRVERAVRAAFDGELLGRRTAISIWDGQTAEEVWTRGHEAHIPASSLKLLTGYVALATLGPEHRFATRVVRDETGLVLVGGGDPLLEARGRSVPSLRTLARSTAEALAGQGIDEIALAYDDSLFSGPTLHPDWTESYLNSGASSQVTALRLRPESRRRDSDTPVEDTVAIFAEELAAAGIAVSGPAERRRAAPDARTVARLEGLSVAEIVEGVVRFSDNYAAEVLLRHVALARDEPGSFAGAAAALVAVLSERGVSTERLRVADGSGLARSNRVTATTLAQALSSVAPRPDFAALFSGLPVAGLTGTLDRRYVSPGTEAGRGFVRAKTGTLNGVNSLTGVVQTADGGVAVFSLLADDVPAGGGWMAEVALDRIAAALAACSCR